MLSVKDPGARLKISDIACSWVPTVNIGDLLSQAYRRMDQRDADFSLVLDDAAVVGVLSRAALRPFMQGGDVLEEVAEFLAIRDVMNANVFAVSRDTVVSDAISLMLRERVRCLPVIEKGRLVGAVSSNDLLAHFRRTLEEPHAALAECIAPARQEPVPAAAAAAVPVG